MPTESGTKPPRPQGRLRVAGVRSTARAGDRRLRPRHSPVGHRRATGTKPTPRQPLKRPQRRGVRAVASTRTAALLRLASADRAVKVWDVETGKRLYTLGDLDRLAWTRWRGAPTSRNLAAAGVDKSIRVWAANADGESSLNTVIAHEKPVWRLAARKRRQDDVFRRRRQGSEVVGRGNPPNRKCSTPNPTQSSTLPPGPTASNSRRRRFDGAGLLIDPATGKTLRNRCRSRCASRPLPPNRCRRRSMLATLQQPAPAKDHPSQGERNEPRPSQGGHRESSGRNSQTRRRARRRRLTLDVHSAVPFRSGAYSSRYQ